MNYFNASIPIKNKKVKYFLKRYPYIQSTNEATLLCVYAQTKKIHNNTHICIHINTSAGLYALNKYMSSDVRLKIKNKDR